MSTTKHVIICLYVSFFLYPGSDFHAMLTIF